MCFGPDGLEHLDNRIIRPPASYSSYDAERKEATVEHRKRLSRFNTTPLAPASSIQALPKKKPFIPAFSYWVFIILVTFAALYSPVPASATANGISGFSGKTGSTCTPCHSNGTAPTVTLTGPTSVASGSTNTYTFMVGGSGNGGLDVAASAGTFTAGTGTKVLSGEIVHNSPSTAHSWTFSWNAPTVTATTSATLFGAAVDSYGGGTGTIQQAITVTAATPAPTLSVSPASLSFNYQSGGATPAAQTFAVSSSGSALSYTTATSATWLAATPSSGTTPGNVSVSVNPTGLTAGAYTGSVTMTPSSASISPKTVAITLTITSAQLSTLNTSPASLSFTYQTGAATPPSQTVNLTSSASALTYTTATSATWLSATPASGSTAGTLTVSVNPTVLAAGTYMGNVTVTSSGASNSPKAVPVTLTVTTASLPGLTASPLNLSFSYLSGGATPAAQHVNLTSSGGALSYTAASSAAWLAATPASGNTPGSLSVSVNPKGLAAGTYTGTVTVASSGASNSLQKITVTLGVTGTPPSGMSLNLTPGSLSFTYLSGTTAPGAQNLSVASSGTRLTFTASATGGSWLTIGPATGSTPATVKVSASPTGLAAGTYNGTITITSDGASNSPQTVPVKLVVTDAGSGRLRVWPPRAVSFDYESGHSEPAPKNVRVLSRGAPLGFTAAALGGTWVSVTPSGGTTPGTLTISVDPAGLASGTYTAMIKLAAPGSTGITVPVMLTVASGDGGEGDDDGARSGSGDATLRALPYAYDPAGTNSVAASWIDGTGAASTIPADSRAQGLLLSKTSAASDQTQAGVVISNADGITLTELGYDIRNGGQCTAKSPRFVVVTSDDVVHKIGCSTGTAQPSPATGWKRLRFDPSSPAQTAPAITPGTKVKSIHLVLDDGPETGASAVVLDNINVNGTFIGKQ